MPSTQSKNVSESSVYNRQQNHEKVNVKLSNNLAKRKNIYDLHINDRNKS